MEQTTFKVRGSAAEPYELTFIKDGNSLTALCTCPARISLLPVLSVNFVGTLGFSIVVPFLVFLVTKWGGNALV